MARDVRMSMSAHEPKSVYDNTKTVGLKKVKNSKTIKHSPGQVSVRNHN